MSKNRNAYCVCCRKSYQDAGPFVELTPDVCICGPCIELSRSMMEEEKRRRGAPEVPVPENTYSKFRNAYCSFCRKSYQEVGPLVEGPGDVYICGECVELCQSIIDQEKARRGVAQKSLPEGTFHLGGCEWHAQTRMDFTGFVFGLMADYQRNAEAWKHRDLLSYLAALARWVDDMHGYYRNRGEPVPDPPTWKSLAEMLMAARVYE
jgi:hypothetical protein